MSQQKTQGPKKIKITRKFFTVILGAVLLYAGVTFVIQQYELGKLKKEQQSLEQQIADNDVKKKELEDLLEYSKTAEFIEAQAREKLGLVKDGEILYQNNGK